MSTQFIPTRHNERNFKQYEEAIATVVNNWPRVSTFDPTKWGYARDTVAHRLREAKKSYSRYHWPSDKINRERFEDIEPLFTVGFTDEGLVWAGPPQPRSHRAPEVRPEPVASNEVIDLNMVACDMSALLCLCKVASLGGLAKRLRIHQQLNETIEKLEAEYDVALTKQEDGTYILR